MTRIILIILVLAMNTSVFANKQVSNLVTPVSYFIDHGKQLNDLKSNLNKHRQASVVGTSGIGKTQLARTYAYENKNQYDLIWFFDCNLDINQEFVRLAKQLNQENRANLSEDPKLVKKEIMVYLSNRDKWLLVFDNLKIGENGKVEELIKWEYNGHVIFVSQDKQLLPHTIELGVFDKRDTVILANNLLENKNNINFLLEAFGNYPILIVQGAQLLNQVKGLDKKKYMQKVHQSADKIKLNIELAIKELKPSAVKLLAKIALINNQSFSKDLLKLITNYPDTLDDDILQLSKFVLIANIDSNEKNPLFEMHDIIAQKIAELNGDKKNKDNLEDIITRLIDAVPKSVLKGRVYRSSKTMLENLEIIFRNSEKYNVNIYKMMELNSNLAIHYANSLNFTKLEDKIAWFNANDQKNKFHLLVMNNDEKARYAAYLGIIGSYYRHRSSDYNKAIEYLTKSSEVFDGVKGYEFYRFNIICQLSLIHSGLGKVQELNQDVHKMEEMLNMGSIDKEDIIFVYYVKAKSLFIQGKYFKALEQIEKTIKLSIQDGLNRNDLFLTSFYLLKANILNSLNEYNEAYIQAQQIHEMHKSMKKDDQQIFGRIFTQMARSELGLEKIDEAFGHITKAISIFLADEKRNPKINDVSEDPDLAAGYVVQGDVFSAQSDLKQALESYRAAQKIYFYLYKNNSCNVAQVSELYLKGAKAACQLKDLYNYKAFGLPQVGEFGKEHVNTITMFEYCKQYDMDLWAEQH